MWSKTKRNREQKSEKKESEKNHAKQSREQQKKKEEGGGAAVESAWIIYWELRHCLCFNLLLFVYVAIGQNIERKFCNMIYWGSVRWPARETAVFALLQVACQKFQRKWIRLWHSILYFGYPLLWQTQQSAAMICQRKVFVTVLCGAWRERGRGGKTIVLELHKQKIFKITAGLWQILSCFTAKFVVLLIWNLHYNCIIYFRTDKLHKNSIVPYKV